MNPETTKISLIVGNRSYSGMQEIRPLRPFDSLMLEFLDAVSKCLMNSESSRSFSDVITFAFFCRLANMRQWAKKYAVTTANSVGRGLTFHIAPSNVPINFAFSLVAGLVAGNACIVRVSSKAFVQTTLVCDAFREVIALPAYADIGSRIAVVRYEHDAQTTAYLSSLCDVRLIWGGDATIHEIRAAALPVRSTEMTFADRFSLCVISARKYLEMNRDEKVALDFYTDTYLFDQNACSSPRLIYWLGSADTVARAKERFWHALHNILTTKNYRIDALTSVNKFSMACKAAVLGDARHIERTPDNSISRIQLEQFQGDLSRMTCAGGSFLEYQSESISALGAIVTRKFQTMTYIGFDVNELRDSLRRMGVVGIDRVVPCGRASEFSLVWDGYDLIASMSRIVDIC